MSILPIRASGMHGPDEHATVERADGSAALKARVHGRLLRSASLAELGGARARPVVREQLADLLRDEAPLLSTDHFGRVLTELTDEVAGLGPLEPLLADPDVTEIMVNGPGRAYVERAGCLQEIVLPMDAAGIARLIERVVAPLGLRVDRSSPVVDARLPDGSRLHAVIPPLAIDGPYLTIRRFGTRIVSLDAFQPGAAAKAFLAWAVGQAAWNIVVAGGTGAGKTSLLNVLAAEIAPAERIVTIEETAELRLAGTHVVRLEARTANAEGAGGVSVRELVRAALRMRPDRLVIGEVRGAEALDMLQALNTGHDGSLSTVHANSPADALARLETLVLLAGSGLPLAAIRAQVGAAVDLIVQVTRHAGGRRSIDAIAELTGSAEGLTVRPLFARSTRSGVLAPVTGATRPPRRADAPEADARWWQY